MHSESWLRLWLCARRQGGSVSRGRPRVAPPPPPPRFPARRTPAEHSNTKHAHQSCKTPLLCLYHPDPAYLTPALLCCLCCSRVHEPVPGDGADRVQLPVHADQGHLRAARLRGGCHPDRAGEWRPPQPCQHQPCCPLLAAPPHCERWHVHCCPCKTMRRSLRAYQLLLTPRHLCLQESFQAAHASFEPQLPQYSTTAQVQVAYAQQQGDSKYEQKASAAADKYAPAGDQVSCQPCGRVQASMRGCEHVAACNAVCVCACRLLLSSTRLLQTAYCVSMALSCRLPATPISTATPAPMPTPTRWRRGRGRLAGCASAQLRGPLAVAAPAAEPPSQNGPSEMMSSAVLPALQASCPVKGVAPRQPTLLPDRSSALMLPPT